MNSLALSLDLWVGPAVQQHIEANNFANYAAYQNYFNNNILNLVNATYNVNVAAFYVQYPITANAVQRITANFQANIREACERIIADRVNIQNLFIDQFPGLTLDSLKAIKSTGSDFHKGGKQVLILTFATSWWWGYIPWWSDLKVVYKPTDLEVDCLLVGNTAAVNNAIGGPAFQAHSLAEIFNARGAANPPAGFEALPTYRILPRNPTSALPMGPGGLPVRNAYGYIEHLGYELTGSQVPYTNLYFYGASDFLIFQYQNEVPIITDFYHRMGQWMALATVFSITDLHLENVRVTKYMPNLIDLEISLTEAFAFDVTATTLFINALGAILGGINGVFNNQEEYVRFARVTGGGGGAHLDLDNVYLHKEFENRLWAMRPAKRLVPVNAFLLIEGLRNGMSVIRDCQQHGVFAPWFARLNNVLVRVLPYGTTTWRRMRKDIYENEVMQALPPVALWPTILQGLQGQLD
ncbi:MAG TPA: DUF4135 domain-containing protein, partial [Candidatus Binatia bacterium]|nr:DUF4135 domain-containing protein [Candidatus Binatia bacterium]